MRLVMDAVMGFAEALPSFYLVETGAPMDSLMCGDCLWRMYPDGWSQDGVQADRGVVRLSWEDVSAIVVVEGGERCCDVCGLTFSGLRPGDAVSSWSYDVPQVKGTSPQAHESVEDGHTHAHEHKQGQ